MSAVLSALLMDPLLSDDTDRSVAIDRTEIGIDHLFGKRFGCGREYIWRTTPSFFMTWIAPLLLTMTSKTDLPARCSAKARSITLVAEARQYSTVNNQFFLECFDDRLHGVRFQ